MKELNCLGDMCPVPIMKLMQIKNIAPGETIKLITDHSCSTESIKEYCKKYGYQITIEEPISGVWEIFISNQEN